METKRIWAANESLMCKWHLKREHRKIHDIIKKAISEDVKAHYSLLFQDLDPSTTNFWVQRHNDIAKELEKRGLKHTNTRHSFHQKGYAETENLKQEIKNYKLRSIIPYYLHSGKSFKNIDIPEYSFIRKEIKKCPKCEYKFKLYIERYK